MQKVLLIIAALFMTNGAVAATLTLDNSTLYGMPGDLAGFGGTMKATPDAYDASTPWIVLDGVDFVLDIGTYPVGVFTPIITNNFVVIGPDDGNGEVNPYTQHFDASLGTGIGSYEINSFQSVGDQANGTLVISYSEFSVSPNDPSFNPDTDSLAAGAVLTLSAPVSVIVGDAGPESPAVPEGSTFVLSALGLMLVLASRVPRAWSRIVAGQHATWWKIG